VRHRFSAIFDQNVAGGTSVDGNPTVLDLKDKTTGKFTDNRNFVTDDKAKLRKVLAKIILTIDLPDHNRISGC